METDGRLIHFLSDPSNYPDPTSRVVRVETHISHVFLCDRFVFKVKKPVNFGFLDFSTLDKRHFFCGREIVLNSRLAKDIYLSVEAIYEKNGQYSFIADEGARIAEYAVKMRRISMTCLLLNLISEGRPLYGALENVGKTLADFHKTAEVHKSEGFGGLEVITAATEENFEQLKPYCGLTVDRPLYQQIAEYTREFIAREGKQLTERKDRGYVRDGHGDLHCEHICLERPPVIFDCIEFNEAFRIIDVLEDIAFLIMDLEYRGRFDLSSRLFRTYFNLQEDVLDLELLRFYKVYRAVVRGKVEGFRANGIEDGPSKEKALRAARDYLSLAGYYTRHAQQPFNPIVFMGLSGSGKSTIARDFSIRAVVLRSDRIRKELAHLNEKEHAYSSYQNGIYSTDFTEKLYRAILEKTVVNALAGKQVIVDATYLKASQRKSFYDRCMERGLNPFFIHCFAEERILQERVKKRMQEKVDISDAHPAILEQQLRDHEEPEELPSYRVLKLNTEEAVHNIIPALREFL